MIMISDRLDAILTRTVEYRQAHPYWPMVMFHTSDTPWPDQLHTATQLAIPLGMQRAEGPFWRPTNTILHVGRYEP